MGGLNTLISLHGYVTCTQVKNLLSWLSNFKKTPLEAKNSLSVGCDAPSTSKRPPTDTCSVLNTTCIAIS